MVPGPYMETFFKDSKEEKCDILEGHPPRENTCFFFPFLSCPEDKEIAGAPGESLLGGTAGLGFRSGVVNLNYKFQ